MTGKCRGKVLIGASQRYKVSSNLRPTLPRLRSIHHVTTAYVQRTRTWPDGRESGDEHGCTSAAGVSHFYPSCCPWTWSGTSRLSCVPNEDNHQDYSCGWLYDSLMGDDRLLGHRSTVHPVLH